MTPIMGDIPFMHDALASIGVQGYKIGRAHVELQSQR